MKEAQILKEVQLENFRSLKDTGLQNLSAITLLVGENSSGKSSFLRAFPLLKQSISKRTSGPILWSGDIDDYVDFGSFEETVTNDKSTSIVFRFRFVSTELEQFVLFRRNKNNSFEDEVDYKISVESIKGKEIVSKFSLVFDNTKFDFDLLKNKILIDDDFEYTVSEKVFNEESLNQNPLIRFRFSIARSRAFGFQLPCIDELWDELLNAMFEKFEDKKEELNRFSIYQIIGSVGNKLFRNYGINIFESDDNSYYGEIEKEYYPIYEFLLEKTEKNNRLKEIIKLCYLYIIFPDIDQYITEYFRNVHYIAPLRATAERYYRLRNLAVDEVDYQGKNLAVFINSLTNKQLRDFNSWTTEHFGFAVSTDKSKGHLSLLIRLKNSEEAINLSDTGFGYSQVLPIITQLWDLSSRKKIKSDSLLPLIVAIEQPELRLHPAVQAKLAKAFIASINLAKENGYQLQLLLETHSETIVNYLGRAISKGIINSNEVTVVLFEKSENDSVTKVKNSSFDEDGFLNDWPYGFFEAED